MKGADDDTSEPGASVPPERVSKRHRTRRRRNGPRRAQPDPVVGDDGRTFDHAVDPRTDEIAREAARLIDEGIEPTVRSGILGAVRRFDAWDAPRPSAGRVREHARSMAMEELGESGYTASVREVWRAAEEVMAVLEQELADADTELVGRVVRGQIDAGFVIHVRVHTDHAIGEIAQALVDHDFEEPDFDTVTTESGVVLDQIRFLDDIEEIAVLRVPKSMRSDRRRDIVRGKRIDVLDLGELRRRLAEDARADDDDASRDAR